MRFWLTFIFLGIISCYQESQPISLNYGYVNHHHERLQDKSTQLKKLKQLDLFEENEAFQQQVEEAYRYHDRALDELLDLHQDETIKNRKEFEQELERFEIVWNSLIDNYLV